MSRGTRYIERMTDPKASINWRNIGRLFLALVVGSIAAIQSYDHQRELAHNHGQHGINGNLFPIIVDVLILYATVSMDGRNRFWPRVTFWAGVGVTISANVLAAPPDLLSQLISAWAPIALLLVIENEAWRNKLSKVRFRKTVEVPAADLVVNTDPSEAVEPKPRQRNARGAETEKKVQQVARKNPTAPITKIAALAGVSEKTARNYVAPVNGTQTPVEATA